MNVKRHYLNLRIRVCQCTHKDSMRFKLELYRLSGAEIGENVRAFSPIASPEAYLIHVGNNVTISTGVKFCTHDNSAIKVFDSGTDFVGKIEIGDNSFIGMNSLILGGVRLPENCIVGAGSVVTKSFDTPGCVIAGNPARVIGSVESIRLRYNEKIFDFRGMDPVKKKEVILDHPEKLLKK